MVNFSDDNELRRWFEARPREVAVVMAARAALRALPILVERYEQGSKRYRSSTVLPCFHAAVTSWLAARFPDHSIPIRNVAMAAERAAVRAADVADGDVDNSTPAGEAAYAAGAAARAVHDACVADSYAAAIERAGPDIDARDHAEAAYRDFQYAAAGAAVTAVKCGAFAVGASAAEDAITGDIAAFEGVDTAESLRRRVLELAMTRLWRLREGGPLLETWRRMRETLLRANEDWDVWTGLYDALLTGQGPNDPAVALAYVTLPDAMWGDGPEVVNAEIKRRLADLVKKSPLPDQPAEPDLPPADAEVIPAQTPRALVFGGPEDAPIGLVIPPGEGLLDSADQSQAHADIRQKAEALRSVCHGSNRLVVLEDLTTRLLDAMSVTISELRVRAFWAQMNALRRQQEADQRARYNPDPEDPPFSEAIAALLYDLVDNLNVFGARQPQLAELDELRLDPAERMPDKKGLEAARKIAEAALNAPTAVAKEAAERLVETGADTSGESPAAERSRLFFLRSARNLCLEALRRAYVVGKGEISFAWHAVRHGGYVAGAAAVAYTSAEWIKANAAAVHTLIDTLGGSAMLHHIIDWIIKTIS